MYYVQAALTPTSNRVTLQITDSIPEAAAFAEGQFVHNQWCEVRVIGHNGRVVEDRSDKNAPFMCEWKRPR